MRTFLFCLFLLAAPALFSQYLNGDKTRVYQNQQPVQNGPDFPECMLCADGALFFNEVDLGQGGGISDDLTCYTSFDYFHDLTIPVNKVIFWGFELNANYYYCLSTDPKNFEIVFYENQAGNVGSPVATFEVTPLKQVCLPSSPLYGGAPLFRYEVSLNSPVDLGDGWISIRAVGGSSDCWFVWSASISDDNLCWQDCASNMNSYTLDFAYCLNGEEITGTVIPVSNWALIFGVLLIVIVTIFRFRKSS